MLQLSQLRFRATRRLWEKSLRRFNKKARWVLWKWMVKGDYKTLKFSEHERIKLVQRQFDPQSKPTIGAKYCDMQSLHEQDLIARAKFNR